MMKLEINENLLNSYKNLRKVIKVPCVTYFVKPFYAYFPFI